MECQLNTWTRGGEPLREGRRGKHMPRFYWTLFYACVPSKQNVSRLAADWQQIRSEAHTRTVTICVRIKLLFWRQSL